jgi:hypothetical protein
VKNFKIRIRIHCKRSKVAIFFFNFNGFLKNHHLLKLSENQALESWMKDLTVKAAYKLSQDAELLKNLMYSSVTFLLPLQGSRLTLDVS